MLMLTWMASSPQVIQILRASGWFAILRYDGDKYRGYSQRAISILSTYCEYHYQYHYGCNNIKSTRCWNKFRCHCSIGASSTGVHTDTSKTYTSNSTDGMNYQLVTGSTGTHIIISHLSVWANSSAVAPTGGPSYQHFDNTPRSLTGLEFEEDNALQSTLYESNIISDRFYTYVIIILSEDLINLT